jgi:hypothetical protein
MDTLSGQGIYHAGGNAGGPDGLLPVEGRAGLCHGGDFRH